MAPVFPYDHIVIGYRTPRIEYPSIKFSPWCKEHIELPVHDCGMHDCKKDWTVFDNTHAKQILEMVEKHKNNIHYIVAQCDAGISRSSATAAAISKILYGDDSWFFNHIRFVPNYHIYLTILKEYFER
jgi:predicted protein tyrosine phosphatase